MWGEGRAYGYSRFKKSMPTENMGVGRCLPRPWPRIAALMLLLLSIIATAAAETLLYIDDRLRLRLLLSVRPVVGCMLCVGESMRLLEHPAGSDSSSLRL